jgi:hypothetical protein
MFVFKGCVGTLAQLIVKCQDFLFRFSFLCGAPVWKYRSIVGGEFFRVSQITRPGWKNLPFYPASVQGVISFTKNRELSAFGGRTA